MEQSVIDAMNDQINFEFHSAFIYLNLSLVMEDKNYKGYSEWLARHYQEEIDHAKQFIDFLHMRGVKPTLKNIEMAEVNVTEPLDVAKLVLEHERKVSASIYKIHDVAKKAYDYATEIFMHEFIKEQIDEEHVTREIVDKFTLAGDSLAARVTIDRELAANQ